MRRFFGVAIFFVLAVGQYSFGQQVCANDWWSYPKTYLPNSGCLISGTVGASNSSQTYYVTIEPGLYQFNTTQTMVLSGVVTGDLGTLCTAPLCLGPVTSFPCQSYDVGPNHQVGPLAFVSIYGPGVHVVTATFTTCTTPVRSWSGTFIITAVPQPSSVTCAPEFVNPVGASPPLLSGNAVTTNWSLLQVAGNVVSGVAADGVTQVALRIPASQAGDNLQLTVVNENGQQDSTSNNGGLFALGGSPGGASATLTVQAQSTSPPMAFAVYRAPDNFNRNGQDAGVAHRYLTVKVSCPDSGGSPTNASSDLVVTRPPVVLVHGLWSNPSDTWGNFKPTNPQNISLWNTLFTESVNYSSAVSVTSTTPDYVPAVSTVDSNALGFSYNAPTVLAQTQKAIADMENMYNVAAVQADVVAHSMGGDIARTMVALPYFAGQETYGRGPLHKLITIGTPHTGTPVAIDLLPQGTADPNACVRRSVAVFGDISLQTVTIGTNPPVSGAVGDLQSPILPTGQPFPIAYLAGTTLGPNLSQLNASGTKSWILRNVCWVAFSNPLAFALTPQNWDTVEFAGTPNDGVVPLSSQLNGIPSTGANTFLGVIHSPGFESLDFSPPSEVDPGSGIPDKVIDLLNEATSGSDFYQ